MSIISALFRQTAILHRFQRQGAGYPIFEKPEKIRCRIQTGKRLGSIRANGVLDQQPSGALMFCVQKPIPNRSVVEYGGREYVVVQCRIMTGFSDNHLEVTLQ